MKKKTIAIMMTAAMVMAAFFVGRYTAPTETKLEVHASVPTTVDLSDAKQFEYACSLMAEIADWNTDGTELAVMTTDGYELYAYKSETVYRSVTKQYISFNEIADVSKETDGTIIITATDGNQYEVK